MHRWIEWGYNDGPCQFTLEQAQGNFDFLISVLGESWIDKGINSPGSHNHPLFREWGNQGVDSFLRLNSLAEDLKLLIDKPHIDEVIRDLKISHECEPAWHTIHMAALFERGLSAEVRHFFPASARSIPDFLIVQRDKEIVVECKMLRKSEHEIRFSKYAHEIISEVLENRLGRNRVYPLVYVIVKDPHDTPNIEKVVSRVVEIVKKYDGSRIGIKGAKFNVVAERGWHRDGISCFVGCFVLSPCSPKENIRAQGRGRKASSQLKPFVAKGHSGICCLGVKQHQNPYIVKKLFNQRFERGQYSGISSVILLRSGTNLLSSPPSVCDWISTFRNPKADIPIPKQVRIRALGRTQKLIEVVPPNAVSAYSYAKILAHDSFAGIQDVNYISPDLLQ